MSKATPRLAKGLGALIGPHISSPPTPHDDSAHIPSPTGSPRQGAATTAVHEVPLDQIHPNPRQPRAALDPVTLEPLAASIRRNGILQPIVLRRTGHLVYELVAGERRWRAARLAGLRTVPAVVRELTDAQAFEAALVENLQREDLTPLERAAAYQQFIDTFHVSIDALAERLGESRANVSNYLRILRLRTEILEMLGAGQLAMGQARAIAGIANPQRQLAVARLAARRNLSVRQVEQLARKPADAPPPDPAAPSPRHSYVAEVQQALSKALGLPVTLQPGRRKNSGRLIITYNSLDEFDRIAGKLGASRLLE